MKRIGVLTSGGDCSGMNAAIRSVVRNALQANLEVIGFQQGFSGLLDEKYILMDTRSVSGILQRAGTILQTARCQEFMFDRGQKEAIRILEKLQIDGLIVIGGNGSLTGALALHQKGIRVIGIPATIDNDIYGTDMAIGVDTALNTIVNCIDIIRDTASSHDRAFIIEVMGRESGYLALVSAIASGAEAAIIPEVPYDLEKIAENLYRRYKEGRTNSLVIVAEGAASAYTIERKLKNLIGYETRISVLGHIQRGGTTTVFDRLLASKFGQNAVDLLLEGKSGLITVLRGNEYTYFPMDEAVSKKKTLSPQLLELAKRLAS
jgi:6-phosphofructokinase 1